MIYKYRLINNYWIFDDSIFNKYKNHPAIRMADLHYDKNFTNITPSNKEILYPFISKPTISDLFRIINNNKKIPSECYPILKNFIIQIIDEGLLL